MSLSRYLKPPPLCSTRITGRHSSYGWLRLPHTTSCVLAFTLVRRCPPPADRCEDLPGYRMFSMSGSTRPRTPGSTRAARQSATRIVAYRRDKTVGTHQPKLSGLNTFKVGSTRYLCTSPAFVPTHRLVCYQPRRKARYWARGARLPRRDSHPLEHAALPGRTDPSFLPSPWPLGGASAAPMRYDCPRLNPGHPATPCLGGQDEERCHFRVPRCGVDDRMCE